MWSSKAKQIVSKWWHKTIFWPKSILGFIRESKNSLPISSFRLHFQQTEKKNKTSRNSNSLSLLNTGSWGYVHTQDSAFISFVIPQKPSNLSEHALGIYYSLQDLAKPLLILITALKRFKPSPGVVIPIH